ncbi:MAG: hypothetical protein IKL37_01360 [Alphaproteobacteria bacterium]|nr:hypothetical protein [Alphaproteobacteria bacterium]
MKGQKVTDSLKNAMGTVFLLAGAFFVCSTLLSMRSVFADPIAPTGGMSVGANENPRASRTSSRTSPRYQNSTARRTVARTATNPRATAAPVATAPNRATPTRSVVTRTATNPRATAAPVNTPNRATPTRRVVSRAAAATNRATAARNVRARVAAISANEDARVSLTGGAIRGSKKSTSSTYSYLTNKLYTGNYSNIIDSSTGLISADAYSNCMESYYTCMDEICTARNAAQRRCACAGRVKAFAEAEAALEVANEELIKVSGELALLVASGGKDISDAFKLTDAEKVLNCISWDEAKKKSASDLQEWCYDHGFYDGQGNGATNCEPKYCKETGNNFGFDVANIDGNSSDILAQLQSWASAKENATKILIKDEDNLFGAFTGINDIVGGLAGISGTISGLGTDAEAKDTLAETWGYDLFEYAHDNVCARVLDSCFNGIYEACGSPSTFGGKCANGQVSSCPFNYNSNVDVDASGNIKLNERGTSVTTNTSATCFGYTTATGDPYGDLRGPVADARRSIINKYLLDANADCDVYGDQLRATAQNIGYQKVAAQQALQQKRLEFKLAEEEEVAAAADAAASNFNECVSEIVDCYEKQAKSNDNWTDARIKSYCAQIANVPHCYEEMICTPSANQFYAVIDMPDSENCSNTEDRTTNTCRNVVTLNEILNGTGADASKTGTNSAALREQCLINSGVPEMIRNWASESDE